MNLDFEIEAARTLATVRELSENATLRPAPRVLCCVPVQTCALRPVQVWKLRRELLLALSGS